MEKNRAAVELGRRGGSRATERQKRAARRNAKKGGWPPMALVTVQLRYHEFPSGPPRRRRMSAKTFAAAVAEARSQGDGWSTVFSISEDAVSLLLPPPSDGKAIIKCG